MHHKACWFPAKEAFDDSVQNLEVFGRCAAPLVRAVATPDDSPHGFSGIGTLFMYGQTGSGKSHTMEGIEGGVAETLSRLLHKTPHGEAEHHPLTANDIEVNEATLGILIHDVSVHDSFCVLYLVVSFDRVYIAFLFNRVFAIVRFGCGTSS